MSNRTVTSVLVMVFAGATLLTANPSKQVGRSAEVLLGAALHQEEVEGNLEAAIETYKKVLADHPDNRPVAARALLQMGRCYEKLGQDEARKAYERLVREYADQGEAAAQARVRLAQLSKPAGFGKAAAFTNRQVWTGSGIDIQGAPSPDGRFLSFVDWETGDLAIRDLETGTNRRVTNKGTWEDSQEFTEFSRWSPDGKQIAYDWYDGKCCVDLRVISRDGGAPRVLADSEDGEWMQTYDWSPDGRHILIFLEKKDGTRQIVLISAADGAARVIKTFDQRGRFPQTMRFSRDGRYVAYDLPQEVDAPEHDVFMISAEGGGEIRLVQHPAHDVLLGWPPDGKGVVFASDRTGSLDMWYLPVSADRAQGPPELIKSGIEDIVPMGFTQGGSFYYAQAHRMLDVYVARMDPQSGKIPAPPEKAIRHFEGRNSGPDYSPDGKYLAYVSTRSRSFQSANTPNILCIRSLETGKENQFSTRFRRLAGTRWSPDGSSVYLAAWDNQGMGIYRVDIRNGAFTPVVRAEGPAAFHRHEISPDGKLFIYQRRNDPKEPFRILSRHLATGEERELLAADERTMFSISPDGGWLALLNTDKKKVVRVMPVGGGEPKELFRFEEERPSFPCIKWTPDGKYIIFRKLKPGKGGEQRFFSTLWRISAQGGKPEDLGLVMAAFQDLSVHPDGRHLAFTSPGVVPSSPAIWVLENFLPRAEDRE
jgi:Tol biopolymer transport system component